MNEFDKTTKNLVMLLGASFLVLLVLGFFIRDINFLNGAFGETTFLIYASGLLFGIVFSIIKVYLIRMSLVSSLKKSKNKATLVSFSHFLTRYILTGLVLYISIKSERLDFFGTMLGVLALQPSSYICGHLIKKSSGKEKVEEVMKELDI